MFYNYEISTEITTYVTNPQITNIKLCHGIIHHVEVAFPSGPQGLLTCTINDAVHQVWPNSLGERFKADGYTIVWREHYPFLVEPYTFQIHTWNEDDTYPHSVIIRIGILPVHVLAPWLLPYDERIKSAMGV